ncbi:uncharacterized protein [Montipora capricornis]|uniref:uncharacterized protein n=1 Tax=Montipora capricornis TaxID=246305 RepID=UPI0035F11B3C
MDGKQQDLKQRKRKPGKHCVVMFCNKTNADGVSLHQFPADESVRQKWIAFVRTKREPYSWTPGSGHICSDHFSVDSYEGFGAKIAGFSSKLVLKKAAVSSIHASATPEQVNEAQRIKRKLPLSNEQWTVEDSNSMVTQETYMTSKLTANRLLTQFDRTREEHASIARSSTNTCKSVMDELPDTRKAENEASRAVKELVAEFRSMANKCTQKGHQRPSCRSKGTQVTARKAILVENGTQCNIANLHLLSLMPIECVGEIKEKVKPVIVDSAEEEPFEDYTPSIDPEEDEDETNEEPQQNGSDEAIVQCKGNTDVHFANELIHCNHTWLVIKTLLIAFQDVVQLRA